MIHLKLLRIIVKTIQLLGVIMNYRAPANLLPRGSAAFVAIAIGLAFLFGGASVSLAQTPLRDGLAAGPVVSPTRLVLEGRERSGSFLVANTSTVPITYRVEFTNQRMLEDGSFEQFNLPRPDEKVLINESTRQRLVLFSPRQFSLQPNQVQVVRLQTRKPSDLPPGEYRSHLVFSAVPPADTGRILDDGGDNEGIEIQLIPIKGVSVPIIVRHGNVTGGVSFSDVTVTAAADNPEARVVNLRMNRSGGASVYGDMTINYVDGSGQPQEVGVVRGIAVYTPNASRTVSVALQFPEGVVPPSGSLQIRYATPPSSGNEEMATASIPIR